jgi:hypothetical protein
MEDKLKKIKLELELDMIMGRNPPTTHTGTFQALPDNLGS